MVCWYRHKEHAEGGMYMFPFFFRGKGQKESFQLLLLLLLRCAVDVLICAGGVTRVVYLRFERRHLASIFEVGPSATSATISKCLGESEASAHHTSLLGLRARSYRLLPISLEDPTITRSSPLTS